jgi:hypothetical protein
MMRQSFLVLLALVACALCTQAWPRPPYGEDSGPFTLDMSATPANRWSSLITERATDIKAAIKAAVDFRTANFGTWTNDYAMIQLQCDEIFGTDGCAELKAIADMDCLATNLADLIYFNIAMEANTKGVLAIMQNDTPFLGYMESTSNEVGTFLTKDIVQPLVTDVRVTNGNTDIDAVVYAGTVGFRAVRSAGLSATRTIRTEDAYSHLPVATSRIANLQTSTPSSVLRSCINSTPNPSFNLFDDCLVHRPAVPTAFYALVGNAPDQASIIGTTFSAALDYVSDITRPFAGSDFLVQTDYVHQDTMPEADANRTATLEANLDNMDVKSINEENLAKQLKNYPIRSIDSVWSVTAAFGGTEDEDWAPLIQQCHFIYDGAEIFACIDPPAPMNWAVFAVSMVIIILTACAFIYGRQYASTVQKRYATF